MKRVLLLFVIAACIEIYPRESIIVDSIAPSSINHSHLQSNSHGDPGNRDRKRIDGNRDQHRSRDSKQIDENPDSNPTRRKRQIDKKPDQHPTIVIDSIAPPTKINIDRGYLTWLDPNYEQPQEDIFYEDYYDSYYEDDYNEEYYYDYDHGLKGFGLSVLKCTYFDKNIFNLDEKIKLNPGHAISLMAYVTNGEYNAAFDFKAAYQTIRFKDDIYSSYDLYLLSFGLRYRKNFGDEYSYPYLLGCLYYNKGYFFNGSEEPITFSTYTAGAGAGYSIYINGRLSFALEGTYETGFGSWDDYPSSNSTGTAINPSNMNFRIIIGVNF